MKTFFTADTHLGHYNIIKYCNRPFSSVEEMDETLITNWNRKVSPMDTVFHLGDFSYRTKNPSKYFFRLNGKKHLIKGNHDFNETFELPWVGIYDIKEFNFQKQCIILFHYAMRSWDKQFHGSWSLYGHTHGSLPDDPKSMSFDIGVDCHNFEPLSFEEVSGIMKKKDVKK